MWKLQRTQQCTLIANKANPLLGYTEKVTASRSWEVIMPLYLVTGEATVGVLCPVLPSPTTLQVKRHVERVQWGTTKMVR